MRPKIKGGILVDGKQVADTLQCVHCNGHFQIVPGSGTDRGFCLRCFGPTCGAKACDPCIPFEKKLEKIEGKERLRRTYGGHSKTDRFYQ